MRQSHPGSKHHNPAKEKKEEKRAQEKEEERRGKSKSEEQNRKAAHVPKMQGFLMLLATTIVRNPHNYYEADFCHEGLIFVRRRKRLSASTMRRLRETACAGIDSEILSFVCLLSQNVKFSHASGDRYYEEPT